MIDDFDPAIKKATKDEQARYWAKRVKDLEHLPDSPTSFSSKSYFLRQARKELEKADREAKAEKERK